MNNKEWNIYLNKIEYDFKPLHKVHNCNTINYMLELVYNDFKMNVINSFQLNNILNLINGMVI